MHFTPRRQLGKTGFHASLLGIGDVADRKVPLATCVATVRRALDAGLNVIDTAPNYEDGYSEEIVGTALAQLGNSRRNSVFLIDKIDHHDEPVAPQVEASLARLKQDHVDLFVFHGLSTPEGWDRAVAPGGGMDQLATCLRAGKLRFRGISSHHPEVVRQAILSGLCDVVMFAVGLFVHERYVTEILPLARERKVGAVCFKTFGAGKLLADTAGYNQPLEERPRGKVSSGGQDSPAAQLPRLTPAQCLHYTLTCDPDVALLGMSFPNEQDAAFAAADSFRPLSPEAMAAMRKLAAEAMADKGRVWWNPPA